MSNINSAVRVWREEVIIPTYETGEPEKNPMFLEKRVYQGSSGVVYPHAVIEKIYDTKIDKSYSALFLENEYLKIMVLPELGGRIQMAYDKVKQRHFVYYNHVIKPALVGLTGPWISGGIEFNWPQHHRPSTFQPIDSTIEENEDGSKTVWVNEIERMSGTKGMAGFTLYPGKAYLEIRGKLYNRTPFPQTFLWWANPAVKVNDNYQSVFPPDVYAVFDHGKRDVSAFPITKSIYYKVDYSPGTDISKYKNIPVPTSYMAIRSKYNFIGGYEHDTNAGLLHIADHHVSPGKKQWTWGNGEFGKAWDRNLTDEDGSYIELMTGVFTDNQPDFSWLQPYEEKTFVQYFMPYHEVGMVKNATKEAVLNVEVSGKVADIKLYVTGIYDQVEILISDGSRKIFSEVVRGSPYNPYLRKIVIDEHLIGTNLKIIITDLYSGKVLVEYQEEKLCEQDIPLPAQAALKPAELINNEQLYLTGLHIEQYRHATCVAKDYYEEAIRRDPQDIRNNNALGLWYLRRGKHEKAEPFFRQAIATFTQRNPNPYDGEAYYNLGWSLKMRGKNEEAFDAFYKSVWSGAWQHAGYLNLARLACAKNNYEEALTFIDKSLISNYHSNTARHIKVLLLRKSGKTDLAFSQIDDSLAIDPFNLGCLFERYLLLKDHKPGESVLVLNNLKDLSRNDASNYIEYSWDYAHAGMYDEASDLLELFTRQSDVKNPLVYYYLGWFAAQQKNIGKSAQYFKAATALKPDYCFPNKIEDVHVLQQAIKHNRHDAKAHYYLGNLWYDKRQYEDAIRCWEESVREEEGFATVNRNLSLACCNKLNDPEKALKFMEKAFMLDESDARILMELDQLYKKLNTGPQKRLDFLERYLPLVELRDDLYLERITLYNRLAEFEKARNLIAGYHFHPWEGGEGKVVAQYLISQMDLAKQAIVLKDFNTALKFLIDAGTYPHNLGEGKLYGTQENDINYLKAIVYDCKGETEKSLSCFAAATKGVSEPVQAIFYNDPQPDKILYQALAWHKLNENKKANGICQRLIDFGGAHYDDNITIDYFAVSLPDLLVFDADLNQLNKVHCLYMQGLGFMGLGKKYLKEAAEYFEEVLTLDIHHQGAAIHKRMMESQHSLFP
ncbi:MAG: DUF5107 domain-containing protein [Chitinophagaceae bacterium]|nr:DUF5107 domain-containing protein [Chitinophagaceae bacterium]